MKQLFAVYEELMIHCNSDIYLFADINYYLHKWTEIAEDSIWLERPDQTSKAGCERLVPETTVCHLLFSHGLVQTHLLLNPLTSSESGKYLSYKLNYNPYPFF